MADETIRSLVVKLGYDVDTTGASVFKSSFKGLEGALDNLRESMDKKTNLKGFTDTFNSRLEKSGKRIKASAKRIFLGVAAAITAAIAGATKVFKGFATKELAEISLGAQLNEKDFAKVKKGIDELPASVKAVAKDVEFLNAIAQGLDFTSDVDFLLELLPFATKKAEVLGKTLEETYGILLGAVGGDVASARVLGFTTAEQEKAKEKAGVKGRDFGIEPGKKIVRSLVESQRDRADQDFIKFTRSASGSTEKAATSAGKAADALGEKLAPTIKKVTTEIDQGFSRFTKTLDNGGTVIDGFINLFRVIPGTVQPVTRETLEKRGAGSTTINNNMTINNKIDGSKEPVAIVREVKRVIKNEQRKITAQALNTTTQASQ